MFWIEKMLSRVRMFEKSAVDINFVPSHKKKIIKLVQLSVIPSLCLL